MQVLQHFRAEDSHFLGFISDYTIRLVKLEIKRKRETVLFPVSIAVIKAVVLRLTNPSAMHPDTSGPSDACQTKMMEMLSIFLENEKVHQLCRRYLLEEVKPLLFHRNDTVVKHIIFLMHKNNYQAHDLRRMIIPHIERKMLSLNLKINETDNEIKEGNHTPMWRQYHGRIAHDFEIKMHVLFPTLHCLGEGSMNDYKQKADQKKTKHMTNNLDILHILSATEGSSFVCSLIAYQARPIPYFFVTERYRENDLSNYLIRIRKEQHWLSEQALVIIACGVINAVSFLHSKGIIHRNLTACQFALARDMTPVLQNFDIALSLDGTAEFAIGMSLICFYYTSC